MIAGITGELAYGPGSLYVDRCVIALPAVDWEDLSAQFPEAVLVFAGAPHVVLVMADEWEDIQAQFPDARMVE